MVNVEQTKLWEMIGDDKLKGDNDKRFDIYICFVLIQLRLDVISLRFYRMNNQILCWKWFLSMCWTFNVGSQPQFETVTEYWTWQFVSIILLVSARRSDLVLFHCYKIKRRFWRYCDLCFHFAVYLASSVYRLPLLNRLWFICLTVGLTTYVRIKIAIY